MRRARKQIADGRFDSTHRREGVFLIADGRKIVGESDNTRNTGNGPCYTETGNIDEYIFDTWAILTGSGIEENPHAPRSKGTLMRRART